MNILLLGSGGRESALAWKMSQSPLLDKLYIAPGNAGTSQYGTNVALWPLDFPAVKQFCAEHAIDMIVVGNEDPLVPCNPLFLPREGPHCHRHDSRGQ